MARKLKVYSGIYDGTRCVVVAAHSRAEALTAMRAAGLNLSMHGFRAYGSETGNPEHVAIATAAPGVVFRRPERNGGGPFVALTPKD